MNILFSRIVDLSITASWLILAVIAARLLLKKAPAAWRGLLWVLVGIKLLCPVSFESDLSMVPDTDAVRQQMEIQVVEQPMEFPVGSEETDVSEVEVPGEIRDNKNQIAVNASSVKISDILPFLWLIGVATMLAYAGGSYYKIHRKVQVSLPYEDRVWICDNINTPFILGIFRPRIYIPSSMDAETAEHVLAHEKAHLKRKDHWWKPLGYLILAVYWFNPLVWAAYILLCRDIELACDEKVIMKLSADQKKAYSEALLNCSIPRKMIAVCQVAFGEVGVKMRVKSVMNYRKPAFWWVLATILVLVVVGVFFMTNRNSERKPVDFSAYLDQDMEVVLEKLKKQGMALEDITVEGDLATHTWSAYEMIGDVQHKGYLEFWNKNEEPKLASIYDMYKVPFINGAEDTEYAKQLIEDMISEYGEPDRYTIEIEENSYKGMDFVTVEETVNSEWTAVQWNIRTGSEIYNTPYEQVVLAITRYAISSEEMTGYTIGYLSEDLIEYDVVPELRESAEDKFGYIPPVEDVIAGGLYSTEEE